MRYGLAGLAGAGWLHYGPHDSLAGLIVAAGLMVIVELTKRVVEGRG